jgi:hypothetical protein
MQILIYIFETFVLHDKALRMTRLVLKNIAVNMQVDKFGFMDSRADENDGFWREQPCTSFL